MSRSIKIILIAIFGLVLSGCVYYNTFYHAKKAFEDAESQRLSHGKYSKVQGNKAKYERARDKAEKVIEKWNAKYINLTGDNVFLIVPSLLIIFVVAGKS